MTNEPRIGDYMTDVPCTVDADADVLEARKLMLRHKVRHVPVVRGEELIGLISDRDIKLMLGPEFAYPDPREVSVADVMVEQPYAVDPDVPLVDVLWHMVDAHIGAALISRRGRLIGIFTAMDACRHLARLLDTRTESADGAG